MWLAYCLWMAASLKVGAAGVWAFSDLGQENHRLSRLRRNTVSTRFQSTDFRLASRNRHADPKKSAQANGTLRKAYFGVERNLDMVAREGDCHVGADVDK